MALACAGVPHLSIPFLSSHGRRCDVGSIRTYQWFRSLHTLLFELRQMPWSFRDSLTMFQLRILHTVVRKLWTAIRTVKNTRA